MNKLLPWILAVCFGLAAIWLAELYMSGRVENALLHDQLRLTEMESQAIRNQLEAERIVERRQLADALGQAQPAPGQATGMQPQPAGK
jgi:hypothetical protein